MNKPAHRVYRFGPFRLDTAERLLQRDGKSIPLNPKMFATLLVLIERQGRLVEKEALMKEVWPDTVVEEGNLAKNIWALRKALGDRTDEGTYIQTVPKVGYRFVAPVTDGQTGDGADSLESRPTQPPHVSRRPGLTVVAVLVTAVLSLAGLSQAWLRRPASPAAAPIPLRFLTDGSHDDSGASWAGQRIYFSRAVSGTRIESWTMDAVGTNAVRANDRIPSLLVGRWSPDGRKVIFVKDGDNQHAYLADAGGANEILLPFPFGNLDWSSDSSRVVHQATGATGQSAIYLYTLSNGTDVLLSADKAGDADPSFSNDGSRIAFTSWRDGNAEIYVMASDGSDVRRVTNDPAFDNYPVFSPDDTKLAFQSNRQDEHVEVYVQNLNDSSPARRITRGAELTGLAPKAWSPDGTELLVSTEQTGRGRIRRIDIEPLAQQLVVGDEGADLSFPRPASDGQRLLYEARMPDGSLELRITNLETNATSRLFKTEPGYPVEFHLAPVWSPGHDMIAFCARADGNSEIFTIKADGAGPINVTRNPLRDTRPAFTADGREIVFTRDAYGDALLYRMNVDGTGQRRLTSAPPHEVNPAVSPDGRHAAFAGDRIKRGLDILMVDLNTPTNERVLVSRRFHEDLPSFSFDGRQVTFTATSDGNPEIYVVNVDGTGLQRLTHTRQEETAPAFSADGRHLLFAAKRAGRFAIYQIEIR